MTIDQLLVYIKTQIEVLGSQKAFAERCGISEQYLTDILKQRREPGKKILKPLGFNRVVTYAKVEKADWL